MNDSQQASEQTVTDKTFTEISSTGKTARIDWRKLFVPSLFIMVLPTVAALVLDKWLGTLPFITIGAIVICFPTATIWVIRIALQEMDRVIAEVTPPEPEEGMPDDAAVESGSDTVLSADVVLRADVPLDAEQGSELPRHSKLTES